MTLILPVVAGAETDKAPVELLTPPGLIKVDGQDAAIDANLRTKTGLEMRHLAYYSEAVLWDEFVNGNSNTPLPAVFAYSALPNPLEGTKLTQADFDAAKLHLLQEAQSSPVKIIDNHPRFLTFMRMFDIPDQDGIKYAAEVLFTIALVEGQMLSLYTFNYVGPEKHDLIMRSHLGWRDEYLKKTDSEKQSGKTDQR